MNYNDYKVSVFGDKSYLIMDSDIFESGIVLKNVVAYFVYFSGNSDIFRVAFVLGEDSVCDHKIGAVLLHSLYLSGNVLVL